VSWDRDPFGTRFATATTFRMALAAACVTTGTFTVTTADLPRIKVNPTAGETPAERGARLAADRRRAIQGPRRGRY
jgi:hypothetical protein